MAGASQMEIRDEFNSGRKIEEKNSQSNETNNNNNLLNRIITPVGN